MNDTTMTIVGNLCADPELKYTASGVALCRFSIASTPRTFDKTKNEYIDAEPLFLTCTAWRTLAENIAETLVKGARVVATGRLKQSRWETETGDKRSAYGLDVDEIGPSLRFATATIRRLTRSSAGPVAPDDPWATASNSRNSTSDPQFDDEAPF